MTKITFPTFICITLCIIALSFSAHSLAKKRCKPLLDKLHSIQSMQRKGYSLKRGQSLRAKEDKARDKWWQCEHSSLAKFKEKYGGKKKKAKKSKNKKQVESRRYYTKVNKVPTYSQNSGSAVNQSSAIVIKSQY